MKKHSINSGKERLTRLNRIKKQVDVAQAEQMKINIALVNIRQVLRKKQSRLTRRMKITRTEAVRDLTNKLAYERLFYSISNQIIRLRKEAKELKKLELRDIRRDIRVADKIPGLNTSRVHYGK